MGSHIQAVEELRQRLNEEERGCNRYPVKWIAGTLLALGIVAYLVREYRKLRTSVDILLLARAKELRGRKAREDSGEEEAGEELLQQKGEQSSPV